MLLERKNLLLLRLLLFCLALYSAGPVSASTVVQLQSDLRSRHSSNTPASLFSHQPAGFPETEDRTADSSSSPAQGQERCLSKDDIKNMLAHVNSNQNATFNKKLRDELLKFREKSQQRLDDDIRDNRKPDELIKRIKQTREKNSVQLCSILSQYGWPTKSMVAKEGVDAAIFMINGASAQLRIYLMPVIIAATKQGRNIPP